MKARSLSFRLTLHSFVLTYSLLLGCWGLVYFSVRRELAARDQEILSDRLRTVETLLQADDASLSERIEREWPHRHFERLYVRVLDENGRVLTQTPELKAQSEDVQKILPARFQPPGSSFEIARSEINARIFEVAGFELRLPQNGLEQRRFVQMALERTEEEGLLSSLQRSLLPILVFGLLGSLWSGRSTVRRTLESIRKISETAQRVTSAGLKERIDPRELPVEFGEIARTLNEMLNRLEESFDRLARFSEDMAHELRTPMNNLLGSLEVSLSKTRSVEEYKTLLGSCVEECGRLKRIIDALLFIARANQPSHEIQKQGLRINEELEAIISFYEASAEKNNVRIRLEAGGDFPLRAERVLLQRAIGNLLSNAIRHSFRGSEILVSVAREDGYAVISVKDRGEGIPPEFLPRIGERFFRVEESRSKSSGGHGLGLSIVKSIVEIHDGRLKVESVPDQGSVFSLHFPL